MSTPSDKAMGEKGLSEPSSDKQRHASSSHSDKTTGEKDNSEISSKKHRHTSSDYRSSHKRMSADNSLSHKSPSHKHHKQGYEIKPITFVSDVGYITSPDITSEEEEEEEQKVVKQSSGSNARQHHDSTDSNTSSQQRRDSTDSQTRGQQRHDSTNSQTSGQQRRDSTNSQTGDNAVALSQHHLKPALGRHGGSYSERIKMIEKLHAIKLKEQMNETGYHKKRAARGEVKKRRAKREFIEGDFSGPCRDKIEYNLEEKPSLRRPEPKPEEPKENKQVKESKTEKHLKQKTKEERKDHSTNKKEKDHSRKEKLKDRLKVKQEKHKDRSSKEKNKDHHKSKDHHRSRHHSSSSTRSLSEKREGSSSPPSSPAPSVSMAEFLKRKSVWDTLFKKKPPAPEKTEPVADVNDHNSNGMRKDAMASSCAENGGPEDMDLGSTGTLHQLIGYDKRKYHDEDEDDRKLAGFSQETKSAEVGHKENLEDRSQGVEEQRAPKKMKMS